MLNIETISKHKCNTCNMHERTIYIYTVCAGLPICCLICSGSTQFNKSPTSSIPKAARTKHDKLTNTLADRRYRKQVVQGHIKPQQNICSPWQEPKDCKKVQQQTSTSDKWRSSRCPRFTASNLHSRCLLNSCLSQAPGQIQAKLSAPSVVQRQQWWGTRRRPGHGCSPTFQCIPLIRPCGHANYYH